MSQVKKYQNAAGPLPVPLGKLTINNKSLNGQLALDRLAKAFEFVPVDTRGMYNTAKKIIEDGNEAVFDPSSLTIRGLDKDKNDITQQYVIDDKINARPTDSDFKRNLQATFNTRDHRYRKSAEYMLNIDMEPEDLRKELRRGNGWFNLKKIKDKKGNELEVFDTNDLLNKDYQDVIKTALMYAVDDEDVDKKFKYSNWKDVADLTQIRNLGNEIKEIGLNNYYNNLLSRLHSGNLSDGDKKLLKHIGFYKEEKRNTDPPKNIDENTDVKGGKGNEGHEGNEGGKDDGSGNDKPTGPYRTGDDGLIYANDEMFNNSTWYLGGLEQFKGTPYEEGFAINGRLYTSDEAYNDRSLDPIIGKFVSIDPNLSQEEGYLMRNKSGVRFVDDIQYAKEHFNAGDDYTGAFKNYNFQKEYNPKFYNFFKSKNTTNAGVRNVTSMFEGLPSDVSVIQYVDSSLRNKAGVPIPRYVATSKDGYTKEYINVEDLAKELGVKLSRYPTQGSLFSSNPWNENGLAQHSEFLTAGGSQRNTVSVDRLGNMYMYRGDSQKPIKIHPDNYETIKKLINGEIDLTNKQLENLKYDKEYLNTPAWKRLANNVSFITIPWTPLTLPGPGFVNMAKQAISAKKFQWGGSTVGLYASKKDIKDLKDAKHDINSTHAIMNATEGGMTKSEKLQLAGAIGDLLGVGISFIPGAHVLGAASGAAASTTKFVGDIKHDGFQGRDLTNYLVNLGLDSASLILPGVGKSVKAMKALKTIKNLAQPITIALAAGGATKAVDTMAKITAGERVDSKDMVDFVQNISKILLGGSVATQVGKEAKILAKESVKNLNKAMNATKSTVIEGKTITKSTRELSDMLENTKTRADFKEMLNRETGKTLTDNQITKALEDFGLTTKRKWKIGKKELVLENKPDDLSSAVSYFFNPWKKNKALNEMAKNLTKEEIKAANYAIRNNNYSIMDKAHAQVISRLAAERPYLFSEDIFDLNTRLDFLKRWTFGGRRTIRNPKTDKPIGLIPEKFKNTYITSEMHARDRFLTDAQWNDYLNSIMPLKPKFKSISPYAIDMPAKSNNVKILDFLSFKNGGKISKFQVGGAVGKEWKFKLSPFLDLGSAIAQNAAIKKSFDYQRKSNDILKTRQFVAPQLKQDRFDTSSIEHKKNLSLEPFNKFKFVSNDPLLNLSAKLNIAENISKINDMYGTEKSDYINRYNSKYSDIANRQSDIDVSTFNAKNAHQVNVDATREMLNSGEIRDKFANIWNTYSQSTRQNIRDTENQLNQIDKNYELGELQEKMKLKQDSLLLNLRKKYNDDTNVNKGTFNNWLVSNRDAYDEYIKITESPAWKMLQNEYKNNYLDITKKSTKHLFLKRGGKIRPMGEKIAINADLEARKAVTKMNDNLMRMFLKLMK